MVLILFPLIPPHLPQNNQNKNPESMGEIKQFTEGELQAINQWMDYKASRNQKLTQEELKLTYEYLANLKNDGYDIIYMIKTSKMRRYPGIMEPTQACKIKIQHTKVTNSKYLSKHYIIPQTEDEKQELLNYIYDSYKGRRDPRIDDYLTNTDKQLLDAHYQKAKSIGIKFKDYVCQYEVEAGISLLEQHIT